MPDERAESVLRERFGLDELAARNLVQYLRDERDAAGAVPDDRTVVIERFRDELGDWRVCILTPFGARIHAPWGMAVRERLSERAGVDVEVLWSDDGIVLRLPDSDQDGGVPLDDLVFDPEEIEALVVRQLPGTGLFGSVFREAAARALLLPRRMPGRRTPLWQQRQRGADLLQVAARHPTFPILLEATRECLCDVFDLPGLREVMSDIRARRVRAVSVETQKASPFAQSLLFAWIAVYMYEGDQPLGERRAAALALDRDLLQDLLGSEDLRDLIDAGALADVELELQSLADGRRMRGVDDLHDLLRRLGDLTTDELDARSVGDSRPWAAQLIAEHRALPVRMAGDERLIAVEDAGRVRDALGVSLPRGVPTVFTEPVERPLVSLVARFARSRGPFVSGDAARRFGVPEERIAAALGELEVEGRVVRGEFRPGGSSREWCDVEVLRSIRRRSLAALRREIEPIDGDALARFELEWQAVLRPRQGPGALADAVEQLQGAALPASILESDVLPARVAGYRGSDLDGLCAAGDVVWTGAGGIGADDGRVALFFRGAVPALARPASDDRPSGPVHDAIRARLASRGASFWPDLVAAAGTADESALLTALWDLVWAGEVTNDTLAPLRAMLARRPRAKGRPRPRPGALRRSGPPAGQGRWSLVGPLLEPSLSATAAAHGRAMQLLERYGVVTRETVLAEGAPGGFTGVYGVLKALEESGKVRRGYFVSGLGAAQFALPGAVDRVREHREPSADARPLALPAADPAQPYGATLRWPESAGRPARAAGTYVVMVQGRPIAFLERGARTLFTFGDGNDASWRDALVELVKDGRLRRIELTRIDGVPAAQSPVADALRERGFVDGYRGLSFRG